MKWLRNKWLWRVLGILTVLVFFGLPFATRYAPMMKSQAEIQTYFSDHGVVAEHRSYPYEARSMHYVKLGADTLPRIVFVHGSPGTWDAFLEFLVMPALLERAQLIAVDRPGYGGSTGGVALSLHEQAASLAPVLEPDYPGQPVIVVGHSYGGGVAARLAIDYPEKITSVVLAAPTLDPELEEIMFVQHLGNIFPFRQLIAEWLDVCNQEMQPLANELEAMIPNYTRFQAPVTMIHGQKDWIVPPGNIDFLCARLPHNPPEVITHLNQDHLIPFNSQMLLLETILTHLDRLEGTENKLFRQETVESGNAEDRTGIYEVVDLAD